MSYDSVILADGPVGYWPLNESSGTAATDLANGNNGIYSGTYTLGAASGLTDGETGVDFQGGHMNVADAAVLRLGAGNVTIECWFKASSFPSYAALFDAATAGVQGSRAYSLFLNAGGSASDIFVALGGQPGSATTTSLSLATGNWYHLVLTSNGTQVNFYINGTNRLVNWAHTAGATNDSNGVQFFGNPSTGGGLLKGIGAKLAVYNKVLTPTQVTAHYTAGTAPATTPVNANPATLKWDLRTTVDSTPATLKWNLRAAVNATAKSLIWNLRAALNATPTTIKWDLRATVDANPRTLNWNLAAQTSAATATLLWNLPAAVNANPQTLQWDLYTQATATRSIIWNLHAKSNHWPEQTGNDWPANTGDNWPQATTTQRWPVRS